MAQDIRKLFKEETKVSNHEMPSGHEKRFLEKLDHAIPKQRSRPMFTLLNIAASITILFGLTLTAYKFMGFSPQETNKTEIVNAHEKSPLGKLSPQLKKVEDYYLANINMELAKMKITPENKELFDGYLERMEELNLEYNVLADELVSSGPTERTVTALIDNLKLRLNLLYRLKEKLIELNSETNSLEGIQA